MALNSAAEISTFGMHEPVAEFFDTASTKVHKPLD